MYVLKENKYIQENEQDCSPKFQNMTVSVMYRHSISLAIQPMKVLICSGKVRHPEY